MGPTLRMYLHFEDFYMKQPIRLLNFFQIFTKQNNSGYVYIRNYEITLLSNIKSTQISIGLGYTVLDELNEYIRLICVYNRNDLGIRIDHHFNGGYNNKKAWYYGVVNRP